MSIDDLISGFLDKQRSTRKNIYVVGDMLIDEYRQVSVNRVNPESPGIVIDCGRTTGIQYKPGGAGNVAYQLINFNANPYIFTLAERLAIDILMSHRLDVHGAILMDGFNPIKQRHLERDRYQLADRVDFTEPSFGVSDCEPLAKRAIGAAARHGVTPDVAILSDYNKGFFRSRSHECVRAWLHQLRGTPTIIDPKVGPVDMWKGCTVFKPNEKEAYELSGTPVWHDQCKMFVERLQCESVVITRGRKGVVGIHKGEFFEVEPQKSVLVESVIGAGDSFVAVLALAIAHQIPVPEAAKIASHAATLYVQNRLNRPLVPAELSSNKIVDVRDLAKRDFKLAFTNGVFDILHVGHLQTIKEAKKYGNKLIVALNSDESVKRLKGADRPINRLADRQAMVAALENVDFVTSFDQDTPEEVIKLCKPDVLVKGGDYKKEHVVGAQYAGEVQIVPFIEGYSTTKTIEMLKT